MMPPPPTCSPQCTESGSTPQFPCGKCNMDPAVMNYIAALAKRVEDAEAELRSLRSALPVANDPSRQRPQAGNQRFSKGREENTDALAPPYATMGAYSDPEDGPHSSIPPWNSALGQEPMFLDEPQVNSEPAEEAAEGLEGGHIPTVAELLSQVNLDETPGRKPLMLSLDQSLFSASGASAGQSPPENQDIGLANLPSVGSAEHPSNCRPCVWYWRTKMGGCVNGHSCTFCHRCSFEQVKQRRRDMKKLLGRDGFNDRRRRASARKPASATQLQ